ncbi:MAG: hypothetical protein ABI678_04370 [Kofleriaceae bacterium]
MRALVCLALLAGTAAAAPNEITFGSNVRALPHADPVTPDSLAGGGLGIGRRLDLFALPHHLELWADTGIVWSGATGQMFQTLQTDLFDMTITAGGHLRYHPFRALAVSGALAVGYQHASLSIEDTAGHTASDTGWGPVARASLQADLMVVDMRRFALGLRAELGYLAAAGIELVPHDERSGSADTLYLPMQEASLGHLDLGGPYFNFGLFSQF